MEFNWLSWFWGIEICKFLTNTWVYKGLDNGKGLGLWWMSGFWGFKYGNILTKTLVSKGVVGYQGRT